MVQRIYFSGGARQETPVVQPSAHGQNDSLPRLGARGFAMSYMILTELRSFGNQIGSGLEKLGLGLDSVLAASSGWLPDGVDGAQLKKSCRRNLVDQKTFYKLFLKPDRSLGQDPLPFSRLGALADYRDKAVHSQSSSILLACILKSASRRPASVSNIVALRRLMKLVLNAPKTRAQAIAHCHNALGVLAGLKKLEDEGMPCMAAHAATIYELKTLITYCKEVLEHPQVGRFVLSNEDDKIIWPMVVTRVMTAATIVGLFVGLGYAVRS
jgi:hypothetical protein